MTKKAKYLVVPLALATAWIPLSWFIALKLAAAQDPPDPSIAPEPYLLKAIWTAISFPMAELVPENSISAHFAGHFSRKATIAAIDCGMFMNGFLWGLLIVLLFCKVLPFIRRKLRGNEDIR
jgi:hypothetical protein